MQIQVTKKKKRKVASQYLPVRVCFKMPRLATISLWKSIKLNIVEIIESDYGSTTMTYATLTLQLQEKIPLWKMVAVKLIKMFECIFHKIVQIAKCVFKVFSIFALSNFKITSQNPI